MLLAPGDKSFEAAEISSSGGEGMAWQGNGWRWQLEGMEPGALAGGPLSSEQ